MTRDALLIGNSVAYGDASKNIPRNVVRSVVADLSQTLSDLESECAFHPKLILDEDVMDARESIRRSIKHSGDAGNFLLIYYFGHAIKPPSEDELYLYFRNSDLDDPGTMIAFSDIGKWLSQYKVPSVLLMLDCCYAGTVISNIRLIETSADSYYIMASVNPKEKALIDYKGERAYGLFSNLVLQAFRNPAARGSGRNVTFKSFYKCVQDQMLQVSKQKSFSVDQNLADDKFFTQSSTPLIFDKYRDSAPKKSIYRKLFLIGSELLRNGDQSERYLYSKLKRRKQEEFLQPRKTANGTLEYVFVSEAAFHKYVRLGTLLGVVSTDDLIALTTKGREMMAKSGRHFNSTLYSLIESVWSREGLALTDFEDAIYRRIERGLPPSLMGIYQDVSLRKPLMISKDMFNVLIDLTGYTGALNYAADKTFFPPIPDYLSQPNAG